MNTTISLPEDLQQRIATAAQMLNMDAEALAIEALERFLDRLDEETRTQSAIARLKAGEMRSTPGEAVFARYLEQGVFTEEDLLQARAEVHMRRHGTSVFPG